MSGIAHSVLSFARVLRRAGLPVSTPDAMNALRALLVIDVSIRDDFKAALRATLVRRAENIALFDQAFDLYFRDPLSAENILSLLLPKANVPPQEPREDVSRRVAEALRPSEGEPKKRSEPREEEVEIDAVMEWSRDEALRTRDFAEMSAEELHRAREVIARMTLDVAPCQSRRTEASRRGMIDLRASLRASLRGYGHDLPLRFKAKRWEAPPVVVLCDISGSMSRYTEMMIRFLHLLSNDRKRVSCFLFGTSLTNVTRALKGRDADEALRRCGLEAGDWAGGTRIGHCLHEFNQRWSRRVLGQRAVVLLITDGLDREDATGLGESVERLAKSCRRLIWLNPLLSFSGFAPKASGIRAILPHVDDFRPVHNLASLAELAKALGPQGDHPTARGRGGARFSVSSRG